MAQSRVSSMLDSSNPASLSVNSSTLSILFFMPFLLYSIVPTRDQSTMVPWSLTLCIPNPIGSLGPCLSWHTISDLGSLASLHLKIFRPYAGPSSRQILSMCQNWSKVPRECPLSRNYMCILSPSTSALIQSVRGGRVRANISGPRGSP